jgi:hypothetical protein
MLVSVNIATATASDLQALAIALIAAGPFLRVGRCSESSAAS